MSLHFLCALENWRTWIKSKAKTTRKIVKVNGNFTALIQHPSAIYISGYWTNKKLYKWIKKEKILLPSFIMLKTVFISDYIWLSMSVWMSRTILPFVNLFKQTFLTLCHNMKKIGLLLYGRKVVSFERISL